MPLASVLVALAAAASACSSRSRSGQPDPPAPGRDASGPGEASAAAGEPGGTSPAAAGEPGGTSPAAAALDPAGATVAALRPLVTHLAPGDPVVLAVRLAPAPSAAPAGFRNLRAIDPLEVVVSGPGGAETTLRAALTADRPSWRAAPTLILTLGATEVTEAFGMRGAWKGPALQLAGPGRRSIALRATLHPTEGAPVPVVSRPAWVEVMDDGRLPLAEIRRRARADLDRRVPEIASGAQALASRAGATESGFVPDVVVEDERGDRVVRFAVPQVFQFELHTVTLSPAGAITGRDRREVATCIAAGTEVAGAAGPVPVEELEPGAAVWGYDLARGRRVLTEVRSVYLAGHRPVVAVGALRLTPDHPVWVDGAWQPAEKIEAGSAMMAAGGGQVRVPAPAALPGEAPVYHVEVAPPHTFFAGGLLVHNKDRGYRAELDDPWLFLWRAP
ncbi:MAG TPA: Hint domain-containing protein [Kofleriaceae bacterium]|nr:Hint domain-containing protein [Kofleriaceae bacterium]